MKNRRLFIILALALVVACAICLVACDPDDGGNNEYILDLIIVDAEGNENYYVNLPDVPYGGSPNFAGFTLYEKLQDGTLRQVKEDDKEVTVTWTKNSVTLPNEPTNFEIGNYSVMYTKQSHTVTVNFRVVSSAISSQFSFEINKDSWDYRTSLPTVTVKDNGVELGSEEYSVCYVTQADYALITQAEDFSDALQQKHHGYSEYTMKPGAYYMFAYVTTSSGTYNSNFVRVTVNKATPTFENLASLSAETFRYSRYYDTLGQIPLETLHIDTYDSDTQLFATAKDSQDSQVYGHFEWQAPTRPVDTRDSGNAFPVKFVPDDTDCYNEVTNVTNVTVTLLPGEMFLPTLEERMRERTDYEGVEFAVSMGSNTEDYSKFVTVTRDGNEMSIEVDGYEAIVDHVANAGTYTYTLSLKDKNNFFWVDIDDYDERYNPTVRLTDDQTFVFVIKKAQSHVQWSNRDIPQLVPDKDGVIKFEIGRFATPHTLGSLRAEYSANDGGPNASQCTADVEVVYENGKEYLVISNVDNNSTGYEYSSPVLYVHFTAESDPNYEPLDEINCYYPLYVNMRPSINATNSITTYAGFPLYRLYDEIENMRTTAGDWQIYFEIGPSEWQLATEDDKLDVGTHRIRLEFDPSNIDEDRMPTEITITVTAEALPEDCGVQAGARFEVPAWEAVVPYLRSHYSLDLADTYADNDAANGWHLQVYTEDGGWRDYAEGSTLAPGEWKCRLVWQMPYKWHYQPDFGVEFTIASISQENE